MIEIVFASSNYYFPYLYVTAYSLIKNNSKEYMHLHILSDNISDYNKKKLIDLKQDNIEITFIDITNLLNELDLTQDLKEYLSNSQISIYSRLFLPSILPDDIKKVLYFDCDSLITGSIKDLWNNNINDYLCAGVKDLMPQAFKEANGLKKEDAYINSGVLLINLEKWRKEHIEEKFLSYIEEHKNQYIHYDQGVINGVCKNNIKIVPLKYNYIGALHVKNPKNVIKWFVDKSDYYNDDEIKEASTNTVFYHFCGGALGRPWTNKKHYYYNLYQEYVIDSGINDGLIYEYSNNIPFISKLYGFIQTNTIGSLLLKIIPASIARKITNNLIKSRI